MERVTAAYEHDLAYAYHQIDKRGMLFHEPTMDALKQRINQKVDNWLNELSYSWGVRCYLGAENADKNKPDSINLNSTKKQLLPFLKNRGFDLPKVRRKNKETHDITFEESVEELVLRKVFAETGDPDIKRILDIREFNTLKKRYIDARRYNGVFYCNYSVTSTITGRRGSKKHIFGYGGNAQTFPKHYDLSEDFRRGVVARPGRLFFMVDQMSAEDWPVSALAENTNALKELAARVDRHSNLAAFLFNVPVSSITKHGIERYLGKKTRHANNYGMRGQTMSDSLAKEGKAFSKAKCDELLKKVNQYDPSIENIFHSYIRRKVFSDYTLSTPFGRERHFHGLRNNEPNYEIFNEAYSYIPQSTVGDNTGFAVLHINRHNDYIVNECHDSINQEAPDNEDTVRRLYALTRTAFKRVIRFHNGISVEIPIEGELGYNLADTVTVKDFTEENCVKAWKELREKHKNAFAA